MATAPARVFPPTSPHVPVFALGPYADPHRSVVLAMKERSNLAVRRHVGAVVDAALLHLEVRGEIPEGTVLVPAPTREASARERGGDPVEACCKATGRPVASVLSLGKRTADQSELDAAARRANLAGAVRIAAVPRGRCIVVDDVVTTGATLQASVETLLAHGAEVAACLAICAA
ncbi:ComF family protein [Corynebacterium aquatimens]|uniref:ComF family protein n=1 Tax=Corynebacterium aquatimens TaxID=1190508 RepID=UPI0025413D97|nr:phosphoribosyltransferase family protein [Corynebacterium aquatimens]